MPATTARPADPELTAPPEKLSAFVARVLDQLSLSAWLPAAFLAASMAVLYRLGAQGNLNVAGAVATLVKDPVTLLVVTVPIVVLTTLVTQSFSFEAIRALEGYWQRRWLLGGLHHLLVSAQARRKATLSRRLPQARDKAFNSARGPMLRAKRSQAVVDAIEADLNNTPRDDLQEADERMRKNTNWREFGDPSAVARYDRMRTPARGVPTRRALDADPVRQRAAFHRGTPEARRGRRLQLRSAAAQAG